jgi:hypothetical protein
MVKNDPYAKIPLKPNQISQQNNDQLYVRKYENRAPAGINSSLAGGRVSSSHGSYSDLANNGLRSLQPSTYTPDYNNYGLSNPAPL